MTKPDPQPKSTAKHKIRGQQVPPRRDMDIIKRTFIHLPGLGPRTEESIWRQGIRTWRDFRKVPKVKGISRRRKSDLDRELERSERLLDQGRLAPLVEALPRGDIWRLYPLLEPGARYLDIETDGLSRYARVTVVGIARPKGKGLVHQPFIRGQGLSRTALIKAFRGATVMVTFNGASFDLPMIRREFGEVVPDVPHIDLRHLARRAGLSGGLKVLERRLGIDREPEVQMIAGDDAVRLWRAWIRKGHKRALEILVDYNREDVVNLAPLAKVLYHLMERRLLSNMGEGLKRT